ncbi:MAG: hypothetical protein JW837_14190 [Sedimentisphaerales bacterium]|nr:hypothetical protein [Sedimentisphaerales bacterium]
MAKQLKTSTNDRKCMFPGCKQILSIYNHAAYCHVHRNLMADTQRAKTTYHHFAGTK